MLNKIYVAATGQHVGKTTSTLGLVAAIKKRGLNVGYCKPVGQEFVDLGDLRVDKDALLFAKNMKFELVPDYHSPVILGRGATSNFIKNPAAYHYEEDIMKAAAYLQANHECVVYEGTGHPGVGSVVNKSNADVAKLIGAKVVMIVEGGIGNTLDRLHMSTALFREQNVQIVGVIVNKVIPEKIEKVTKYVGMKLKEWGIPLLGVVPYDKRMMNPIIETINRAVDGYVIANFDQLDRMVESIIAGSLVNEGEMGISAETNVLMVASKKRLPSAIERIKQYQAEKNLDESPLSGIVITGDGSHEFSIENEPECGVYIRENKIPVISTALDPLGAMIKINRIEVKINTRTPWKIDRAIELIDQHVNLDLILND